MRIHIVFFIVLDLKLTKVCPSSERGFFMPISLVIIYYQL